MLPFGPVTRGVNVAAQTKGEDYAWSHPSIAASKAAGITFVSRYLSYLPNGKVITHAEASSLLNAGIDVLLNWECDAKDALRGAAGGTADGKEANRQARALGYPAGAELISSMDWDVTPAQKPTCLAYARAFAAQIPSYRYDVYGGYWIVKYLFDNHAIFNAWQAYAWSGGLWDPRATLRQTRNGVTIGGASVDLDVMYGQAHTWLHPKGAGTTPVATKPTPVVVKPVTNVHGIEGEDMATIIVQDGQGGPVYVGSVGGAKSRLVPNLASLDNLRYWLNKAGVAPTVNVFAKGTYVDVIGPAA